MKFNGSFGSWLKQRRQALDLTQKDLAGQVGCAPVTVRKMEANVCRPSKQMAGRLADVLAISHEEQTAFLTFARGTVDNSPAVSIDLTSMERQHHLPAQTTAFVGRQSELSDITRLMTEPDIRLVTILAPGGMGKTRLGLAAGEQLSARFTDGVYFIPLAPLRSPDDMITTIAEHLGFSFYGSESPKQQLLNYLRERSAILILDNFEHLLDGIPLIIDLLETASHLRLLITSREKLNVSGETLFTLSGLNLPNGEAVDALESDAARLFVQSAHRIRPNFVFWPDDLDALARICRLTGGMPLALTLAVGWMDVLTLQQIAAEIEQGIDILASELRDVPERHRSIRACFNHTWERLSGVERQVFMKLSVFRGGFTAEAAQQVAEADSRHLRKLVDRALVQALQAGRYDIHEMLRQYGETQLTETGETAALRQAHSDYYINFLAEREDDVKGRRQQAALEELRRDFENVRQGWLWAADHRQYEAIRRALNCLILGYEMNNQLLDGQRLLYQTTLALQPTTGETPHPVWDAVSIRLDRYNFLLGQPTDPDGNLLQAILERSRTRKDDLEAAWCHWQLAADSPVLRRDAANQLVLRRDAANQSFAHFDKLLTHHRQFGDEFYIAHGLIGVSWGYVGQNQVDRALNCQRESVHIRRRIGDWNNLPFSLFVLAQTLMDFGAFAEAETRLDEALKIMDEIGITPIFAICLSRKATLAFWRGEFDLARRGIDAAIKAAGKQNYIGNIDEAYGDLSFLLSLEGAYQEARALCAQSRSHSVSPAIARFPIWGYALASCGLGDDEAAREALRNTLQITVDYTKSRTDQQLCLPIAAILAARAGHAERAVNLLRLAYAAPHNLTGWMRKWSLLADVQNDLEAQLGSDAFAAAWEHGQALELPTVVDELLDEYVS